MNICMQYGLEYTFCARTSNICLVIVVGERSFEIYAFFLTEDIFDVFFASYFMEWFFKIQNCMFENWLSAASKLILWHQILQHSYLFQMFIVLYSRVDCIDFIVLCKYWYNWCVTHVKMVKRGGTVLNWQSGLCVFICTICGYVVQK